MPVFHTPSNPPRYPSGQSWHALFYSLLIGLFSICNLASAQISEPYRILLSNDDGITSPLLHTLQREIASIEGVEVVVVAPAVNQSGSSQSSTGGEIRVDNYRIDGSLFGYAVHGRPADAVRFGLIQLGSQDDFDLVVSGINRGANVGDVSHLSGTVGAAMEALYQGKPAIAVSQEVNGADTEASARFVANLVRRYMAAGAPEGYLVSINIPAGELRGVRVRPMGDSYLQTATYDLLQRDSDGALYEAQRIIVRSQDESTDTYAYQQGYITLTPLQFDWTAEEAIGELESWNLQLVN